MAHFAVVNSNNIVIEVIVISNDEILDENGQERESLGIAKCIEIRGSEDHPGTYYMQCSRNDRIRGRFAAKGFVYDPSTNIFHPEKPAGEWVLNSSYAWEKPGRPEQTQQMTDDGVFSRWQDGGWALDVNETVEPPALSESEEETHYWYWDQTLYKSGSTVSDSWVKREIETPAEE